MKLLFVFSLVIIWLTGCLPQPAASQSERVELTPWQTKTASANESLKIVEDLQPTSLPTLQATAIPTIHTVTLGETISSIALRYGMDMNTLLAANPEIDPYSLIVGDQVLIPSGETQLKIGIASKPLELMLSEPKCDQTPEGGLWCFTMLTNTLDESALNLSVTFSLNSGNSENEVSQTVPAILNKLEIREFVPAVVYFAGPIAENYQIAVNLTSALAADQSDMIFFPVKIVAPSIKQDGRFAKVTGEVIVDAKPGTTVDVWVAAMAYDDNDQLVGVRRTQNRVTLEEGKGLVYQMNVYSTGKEIDSVVIKAEAMLAED